jgi:L-asparaginase II
MHGTLAEFAGLEIDEIPTAIDGCGVPAYFMSLHRTAFAYARLMSTSEGAGAPGAIEPYVTSAEQIVEAMTTFPQYVAGGWSMTTPLMEAFGGELLAKEGAEGLYAMALAPSLVASLTGPLRVDDDLAIGVAIKVSDGSMFRGRNPIILKTLELLGADITAPALQRWRDQTILTVAGLRAGEVRAEFELEMV